MISLIEALDFRCLRYVQQRLGQFQVLVGPNASGKTTFLDVVGFLGQLVSEGLDAAIGERTQDFVDLVWGRSGTRFELAIEASIPEDVRVRLAQQAYDTIRYEVGIGLVGDSGEVAITTERGWLKVSKPQNGLQRAFFPSTREPPATIFSSKRSQARSLFSKSPKGNDHYYADAHARDGRWAPAFKLGPRKSTLGNLPEDESNFPASTWFKQLLSEGVQQIVLNSLRIRRASPPGQERGFKPDGSNLPWVIAELEKRSPQRLQEWVMHLRTALPDLESVKTHLREDDRHRYLTLVYAGGLEVPSWMASDGTLRLLALTLPAYLDGFQGVYLIEEPENGIHPRAIETMFQSLSSVYNAQIFLATHSPVILGMANPEHVLCFAKTADGATDIVAGSDHPKLRDWQGQTNLGELFAAGVFRVSTAQPDRDLIVLVADKDIEFAVKGLLTRTKSLSVREVTADIYPHPQRDPGCARRCHDFLCAFCKQYRHALVVFDLDGSGNPGVSREQLEAEVEDRLSKSGWQSRAAVVVLDPELEVWVWSDSPEVPKVLGWSSPTPDLESWLRAEGFLEVHGTKPAKPKEAMEAALRRARKRRSSSLYFELACRVSLRRCTDRAFAKLTATLQDWFPSQ